MRKVIIILCCSVVVICLVVLVVLSIVFKVEQPEYASLHNITVFDDRIRMYASGNESVRYVCKYKYRIEGDSLIFKIYCRHALDFIPRIGVSYSDIGTPMEILCDTREIQKVIYEAKSGELEILWDRSDETVGVKTKEDKS